MENALKWIRSRRSVRTFRSAPSEEDARKILEFAEKAGNPYDIPISWKLLDAKKEKLSCPVIVGTDLYLAGKMKRLPHAEEAFGYSLEQVVLFAGSLGIGTTWIAGTMDRDAFQRAVVLGEDEVMPCITPLGYPEEKMSLRETMMRKGVRADSRLDLGELVFDGNFREPLPEEKAGKLRDVLEAVRLAPSAVNRQPWRLVVCGDLVHFYEKCGKGFGAESGWDIQKIDMGIALSHFELAAEECGLSASLILNDPEIPSPADVRYIASWRVE